MKGCGLHGLSGPSGPWGDAFIPGGTRTLCCHSASAARAPDTGHLTAAGRQGEPGWAPSSPARRLTCPLSGDLLNLAAGTNSYQCNRDMMTQLTACSRSLRRPDRSWRGRSGTVCTSQYFIPNEQSSLPQEGAPYGAHRHLTTLGDRGLGWCGPGLCCGAVRAPWSSGPSHRPLAGRQARVDRVSAPGFPARAVLTGLALCAPLRPRHLPAGPPAERKGGCSSPRPAGYSARGAHCLSTGSGRGPRAPSTNFSGTE